MENLDGRSYRSWAVFAPMLCLTVINCYLIAQTDLAYVLRGLLCIATGGVFGLIASIVYVVWMDRAQG